MPDTKNVSTKLMICEAFEKLLETNPTSQVTVKKITDACSLTRQTFYNNFRDIYDLIFWMHDYKSKGLASFAESKDFVEALTITLKTMTERKRIYIQIVKIEGQNSFASSFLESRIEFTKNFIGKSRLNDELLFSIRFYWTGVSALLIEWVQNNMEPSPEIIAQYFYNCLPPAVKKFYE